MRVLITGAAGMIGRKLVDRLAKDGKVAGQTLTALDQHDVVEASPPDMPGVVIRRLTGDLADQGAAAALVAGRHDLDEVLMPAANPASIPPPSPMPAQVTPHYWDDACKHLSKRDREVAFVAGRSIGTERVAARVVRAIRRNEGRVLVGADTWGIEIAMRVAPGLTNWLVAHLSRRLPFV